MHGFRPLNSPSTRGIPLSSDQRYGIIQAPTDRQLVTSSLENLAVVEEWKKKLRAEREKNPKHSWTNAATDYTNIQNGQTGSTIREMHENSSISAGGNIRIIRNASIIDTEYKNGEMTAGGSIREASNATQSIKHSRTDHHKYARDDITTTASGESITIIEKNASQDTMTGEIVEEQLDFKQYYREVDGKKTTRYSSTQSSPRTAYASTSYSDFPRSESPVQAEGNISQGANISGAQRNNLNQGSSRRMPATSRPRHSGR